MSKSDLSLKLDDILSKPFWTAGDIEVRFQCFNICKLYTASSASSLVNITLNE